MRGGRNICSDFWPKILVNSENYAVELNNLSY